VLLACAGLDHAWRGFESFARECFEALRDDEQVDIRLAKGSGPAADRERAVHTLTRDSALLRAVGRATRRDPFRFEHLVFALTLQPLLVRERPDLVYFSEWHTGLGLAALRRITRGRHRLLLSNGTMAAVGFGHLDHVQQLTPAALDTVLSLGADPARHTMLPLPAPIPQRFEPVTSDERGALRRRHGLPLDRRVVLSVAALNRHHKRLDYLIEEVGRLPEPRPFVLMAGAPEAETATLRALARERLGADGFDMRTVPHAQVRELLRASDVHVLASLGEALGRVLIEAMAEGLPCLAHDYAVTRFVLGEHGGYADFTRPGALAGLLGEMDAGSAPARHAFAYERFSWDRLRPRYVELFRAVANSTVSSSSGDEVLTNRR
jgi:glycosyltransferase involved in cell wall biosynthesis